MPQPAASWRNRVKELRYCRPAELQDHPHQWRTHPTHQRDAITGVLKEIGIAGALLVYDSAQCGGLVSIDGHMRKSLDPQQLWPCLVLDVDDAEAAYLLSTHDPIAALAGADTEKLAGLVQTVQTNEAAVQKLLAELAAEHGVQGPDPGQPAVQESAPELDRGAELRAQYGVEPGQIWQCGRHRVLCGNCTDISTVLTLMGQDKAALVVTSPPYAVGKEYEKDISFAEHMALLRGFADCAISILAPGGFIFTNFGEIAAQSHTRPLTGSARQCIYPISKDYWQIFHVERQCDLYAQRIWYKPFNRLQQPFWTYHTSIPHHQEWEHIWTWRAPGGDDDTVYDWDISVRAVWDTRQEATDDKPLTRHVAAFPVGIPERAIKAHSKEDAIIYEPFLGSGTTMIACEQLSRICRGVEISPEYVAVALHRWATLTGHTPTLLSSGS